MAGGLNVETTNAPAFYRFKSNGLNVVEVAGT